MAFRTEPSPNRIIRSRHDSYLQEFRSEQGIPVMNQISLADQEAFRNVTEVPSHLAHAEPIAIPRDSGDLNPTTRQVPLFTVSWTKPILTLRLRRTESPRRVGYR